MPIKRKDFDKGNFNRRCKSLINSPIVDFLRKNKSFAFKAKEISRKTKVNIWTTRSSLTKLVKKKVVLHNSPYFAFK